MFGAFVDVQSTHISGQNEQDMAEIDDGSEDEEAVTESVEESDASTPLLIRYEPRIELFLEHELGLQYANYAHHIFFMYQLYNRLQQSGRLSNKWQAIESITDLNINNIFLGERPTSAETLASRFLLAIGVSPEAARPPRKENQGRLMLHIKNIGTKKDASLVLPPIMAIFAEHIHDKEPLIRTLCRADAEMAMQASRTTREHDHINSAVQRTMKRPIKSFIDDLGPLAFLKELQKHSQIFERHFAIDYVEMTRICEALFQKIQPAEMQLANRDMEIWDMAEGLGDRLGEACTTLILKQLAVAEQLRRCLPPSAASRTRPPFADRAASVLQEYIQAGATGIPT